MFRFFPLIVFLLLELDIPSIDELVPARMVNDTLTISIQVLLKMQRNVGNLIGSYLPNLLHKCSAFLKIVGG